MRLLGLRNLELRFLNIVIYDYRLLQKQIQIQFFPVLSSPTFWNDSLREIKKNTFAYLKYCMFFTITIVFLFFFCAVDFNWLQFLCFATSWLGLPYKRISGTFLVKWRLKKVLLYFLYIIFACFNLEFPSWSIKYCWHKKKILCGIYKGILILIYKTDQGHFCYFPLTIICPLSTSTSFSKYINIHLQWCLETENAALWPLNVRRESNLQGISMEWRISDNTWLAAEACIRSCLQGSHKIGQHLREGGRHDSRLNSVSQWRPRRRSPRVAPTVHPADAKRLQDGEEQKCHPTAGVVIKQLEDVESTLRQRQTAAS